MLSSIRTRKYLHKMVLTIMSFVAAFLVAISGTVFYYSDSIVRHTREEANHKVLAQASLNIGSMNEIVKTLAMSVYFDNELRSLFFDRIDIAQVLMRSGKLDKLVASSSFLHSIVIYNQAMDAYYGGGDVSFLSDRDPVIEAVRQTAQISPGKIAHMKLVPMYAELKPGDADTNGKVGFFSLFMYDSLDPYQGESMLVLNIKPEWIVSNIQAVNRLKGSSSFFLMDADNRSIIASSSRDVKPENAELDQLLRRIPYGQGVFASSVLRVDDKRYLATVMDLADNRWRLVTLDNYADMMKQVTMLRRTSIGIALLFLLTAVLLSPLVSRRLYRPVETVLSDIRKLGSADDGQTHPDEWSFIRDRYRGAIQEMNRVKQERRDILRTFYLTKWLTENLPLTEDEWAKLLADHRIPIDPKRPILLALLRIDRYPMLLRSKSPSELQVYPFAVGNIASEMLSSRYVCVPIKLREDQSALLIQPSGNGEEALPELADLLRATCDTVHRYYHITFTGAVGDPVVPGGSLPERYRTLSTQLDGRLMFEYGTVITPDKVLALSSDYDAAWIDELHGKLSIAMIEGRPDAVEQALNALFDELARYDYDGVIQHLMQLLTTVRLTVRRMDQHRIQALLLHYGSLFKAVLSAETLAEAKAALLAALTETAGAQAPRTGERRELIVEAMKEIIRESYLDPTLNLSGIAAMVRMSETYAGKLFRDAEGMSAADYLNEVRLDHAKRMLEETDDSVNKIMERCGFSNQSNFFRQFKRRFGTTPKELRLTSAVLPRS
ncbi:helix-turn-helix domain-containing protein [Cohnella fermenti]|uniref:Helix-turn-helix transcriptional regulator n=1 Tax=Cohnella fermenti TaxID=2565925 RepID=A0A4S4C8A1_9BACL|nr:helix-turn-helix domain-containing protein [Cohnella fermenti]THF84167.1 helix-turn-helix transcriptional regulator [Cohnella fermenti]